MEYYSAIKRKEITAFAATWKDPEMIMQSEVSQRMRDQHQMLPLTCGIFKKGDNEPLCRADTDSQTLKNLRFPNEKNWGGGSGFTEGLGWKCYKIWL